MDRINYLGHYIPSNVQYIAKATNTIKQNMIDNPKRDRDWPRLLTYRAQRAKGMALNILEPDRNEQSYWSKLMKDAHEFELERDYVASKLYDGVKFRLGQVSYIVVDGKAQQYRGFVLACVDKDLIGSVPGKVFNYYESHKYGIEMKWVETSPKEAYQYKFIQTLMGDSTDNIKGCPGVGKVKANKLINGLMSEADMWSAVLGAFAKKGLTEKEALRDMRLVNMEQVSVMKTITLWEPPCNLDNIK